WVITREQSGDHPHWVQEQLYKHYKKKEKQRQLTLASGGGFELSLYACCGGFQASQFSGSLGYAAAVLATVGITVGMVFSGSSVYRAAVFAEIF
ncbi:hypothetical protein L195_g061743, partial [Trifolium pratense]